MQDHNGRSTVYTACKAEGKSFASLRMAVVQWSAVKVFLCWMGGSKNSRVIMCIEITPEAKELLTNLCERSGMKRVAVMSRITEWFARHNLPIQGAILGHYPPENQGGVAKLILDAMIASEWQNNEG